MRTEPELNRRSLLRLCGGGMLVLALPVLPSSALGTAALSGSTKLVLVDARYGMASVFAARVLGPNAAAVVPVGRDLAELWYRHIAPRLVRALAIEAITLPADLFGIERLAEGLGGVTEVKSDLIDESEPRRGRPKHLVYWRMRFGGDARTAIG